MLTLSPAVRIYLATGATDLRRRYGPNEKSVMHDHPANVAVFLSSGKVKMNLLDGKSAEVAAERNAVQYSEAQSHLPEMTSAGAEAVVVELKTAGGSILAQVSGGIGGDR